MTKLTEALVLRSYIQKTESFNVFRPLSFISKSESSFSEYRTEGPFTCLEKQANQRRLCCLGLSHGVPERPLSQSHGDSIEKKDLEFSITTKKTGRGNA